MYVCSECNGLAKAVDFIGGDDIVECVDCGHTERRGPSDHWTMVSEPDDEDSVGRGVSTRSGHPLESELDSG